MGRYHATAHPLEKIKIGGIENAKSAHRDMTSHHYAATPVGERKIVKSKWFVLVETARARPLVKMKVGGKENAKSAHSEMTTTHCCIKHNDQFQS